MNHFFQRICKSGKSHGKYLLPCTDFRRFMIFTGAAIIMSVTNTVSAVINPEVRPYARKAAEEGIVLLKNERKALPFAQGEKIAVFGCAQIQTFMCGYGSGGGVEPPYKYNIIDGLLLHQPYQISLDKDVLTAYQNWCTAHPLPTGGWGNWPLNAPEMPLEESLVKNAASRCGTALVILGRAAGEDRECKLEAGSYYLTDLEKDMLKKTTSSFRKTIVVVNSGNIIDMSWLNNYPVQGVVYAWQGGMETGPALAEVLCGNVSPSGHLAMAIANHYEDYPSASNFGNRNFNNYAEDIFVGYRYFETFAPEKVMFPFGYGLSYNDFEIKPTSVTENKGTDSGLFSMISSVFTKETAPGITVKATVTNKGGARTYGKEVVQVYCAPPQGKLGKPARVLVGYAKTPLLAPPLANPKNGAPAGRNSCEVTITFPAAAAASFDDSGATGHQAAWVLEAGTYDIYVGNSVRSAVKAGSFKIADTIVTEQLESACAVDPANAFDRMVAKEENGKLVPKFEKVALSGADMAQHIRENLPKTIKETGDKGIKLIDVYNGKNTLDEFIAQLTPEDLAALLRGDMNKGSRLGPDMNASVYGGVTQSLRDKGIPAIPCDDGPSGLWLHGPVSLLPIGSMLACTWNTELVEKLYYELGNEIDANGFDAILGPGMNVHRNILCGRNFEYFSEDPLLAGTIGGASVRGLQNGGVTAVPKHYALNNQEVNRNRNDSRCSERAMREIYLRAFEIMVKTGKPENIMGSYNLVNGEWASYNFDLCTLVLRKQWGWDGMLMTDWWQQAYESKKFYTRNNALRVRAQTDVLMPGEGPDRNDSTILQSYKQWDAAGRPNDITSGLTLGEMQRSAANVLKYAMRSRSFRKLHNLPNLYKPGANWFEADSVLAE